MDVLVTKLQLAITYYPASKSKAMLNVEHQLRERARASAILVVAWRHTITPYPLRYPRTSFEILQFTRL